MELLHFFPMTQIKYGFHNTKTRQQGVWSGCGAWTWGSDRAPPLHLYCRRHHHTCRGIPSTEVKPEEGKAQGRLKHFYEVKLESTLWEANARDRTWSRDTTSHRLVKFVQRHLGMLEKPIIILTWQYFSQQDIYWQRMPADTWWLCKSPFGIHYKQLVGRWQRCSESCKDSNLQG